MKIQAFNIEKVIDNEEISIFPTLIQQGGRNYLIDCGYIETQTEIENSLKDFGVAITDLTGIIITHDDYDHLGGLAGLKQLNPDIKVFCGNLEEDSVSGHVKSERLIQAENSLLTIPDEYKNWALNFIAKLERVERVSVDTVLCNNEIFENKLQIIHTPGHTKGHISLFYSTEKTLIAGDALVIENGEFNIANPAFTLDMNQAVESVKKIKNLAPRKIICYHGGIVETEIDTKLQKLINRYTT